MEGTYRCARCHIDKPFTAFHLGSRGRPHGYCKPCRREYNRQWYQRNRHKHIRNVQKNSDRYRARNRSLVDAIKDQPCADCGKTYPPPVMEFDHIGDDKSFDVSFLAQGYGSVETLLREIAKCELVCANCHRLRTAARGWGRGRSSGDDPQLRLDL